VFRLLSDGDSDTDEKPKSKRRESLESSTKREKREKKDQAGTENKESWLKSRSFTSLASKRLSMSEKQEKEKEKDKKIKPSGEWAKLKDSMLSTLKLGEDSDSTTKDRDLERLVSPRKTERNRDKEQLGDKKKESGSWLRLSDESKKKRKKKEPHNEDRLVSQNSGFDLLYLDISKATKLGPTNTGLYYLKIESKFFFFFSFSFEGF
jgi:hypothetical protein